jgi:F-type H+-transporting ATPase subunit alpha
VRGYEVAELQRYEREMLGYVRQNHGDVLKAIRDSGKLEEDTEQKLAAALDEFTNVFQPSSGSSDTEAA